MKISRKKAKGVGHWAKSSTFISLVVHVVIILVAGSIVAVRVAPETKADFKGHRRARPKMKMKRLQIPVQVQKMQKVRKPQVKSRLSVKNVRVQSSMPDLKLSDKISGSLGGSGVAGMGSAGLGAAGSLGFSLSTVDFMGVKSKGEKICFLLDTKSEMVADKKGGLWAYNFVKQDAVRNIGRLGSATLFNVITYYTDFRSHRVYDSGSGKVYKYQPKLVPATKSNKAGFEKWLAPINKKGAGDGVKSNYKISKLHAPLQEGVNMRGYLAALHAAMEMKPDVIYLFTCSFEGYEATDNSAEETERLKKESAARKKKYPYGKECRTGS